MKSADLILIVRLVVPFEIGGMRTTTFAPMSAIACNILCINLFLLSSSLVHFAGVIYMNLLAHEKSQAKREEKKNVNNQRKKRRSHLWSKSWQPCFQFLLPADLADVILQSIRFSCLCSGLTFIFSILFGNAPCQVFLKLGKDLAKMVKDSFTNRRLSFFFLFGLLASLSCASFTTIM